MNLFDLLQNHIAESYDTLDKGLVGQRMRNPRDQEVVADNALTMAMLPASMIPQAIKNGSLNYAKGIKYTPEQLKLSQTAREAQQLDSMGLSPLQAAAYRNMYIRGMAYPVVGTVAANSLINGGSDYLRELITDVIENGISPRTAGEIGFTLAPANRGKPIKHLIDLLMLVPVSEENNK